MPAPPTCASERPAPERPVPNRPAPGHPAPGHPAPGHPAPDRYADAVRARRAELRAAAALLLGGHRAELRTGLAAARLAASAGSAAALAAFERELRHHVAHADRRARAALPDRVADAVDRLAVRSAGRWAAAVLPAVRRVATARGLPVPWPAPGPAAPGPAAARRSPAPSPGSGAHPLTAVLARPPAVTLPAPDPPPGVVRAVLAGTTAGAWRPALLPAAVLPAVGLPVLGGRSALPLAVALGLALLAVAVRAHHVAADRARLRRWGAEVVATVRGALETELSRRLLEVERLAGRELDDAVTRRRAQVERALRELAPDRAPDPVDGRPDGGRVG